jgi:spore coat protein I
MQGIDREVSEKFGLDVKSLVPYKDTLIAITPHGRRIIRKIPFSAERLRFIHGAKEHLISNGFIGVDRYICTLDGEPYFLYDGSIYTMIDFPEGRESSFDNDDDVRMAAVALGLIHKASKGYIAPDGCKIQDDLGKLPGYFNKRLEDIKKMKKQAKKWKGRFDQLFLDKADQFYEMGQYASGELLNSSYDLLVDKARKDGLFCHHDYTHHNILINDQNVTVTNFDYCCYELRIYDLANFIRRKMRKCGWDISKADKIINWYNSIEALSNEELVVMRIILQFPQKFWRVINRYYNSRRSWSEKSFVLRLQEVIDEMGPHMAFIEEYRRSFE